jgi:hypothetical protein
MYRVGLGLSDAAWSPRRTFAASMRGFRGCELVRRIGSCDLYLVCSKLEELHLVARRAIEITRFGRQPSSTADDYVISALRMRWLLQEPGSAVNCFGASDNINSAVVVCSKSRRTKIEAVERDCRILYHDACRQSSNVRLRSSTRQYSSFPIADVPATHISSNLLYIHCL